MTGSPASACYGRRAPINLVHMSAAATPIPAQDLAAFCRRHHIRKLSLFGSRLRGDHRPDSDLDVLAEFDPAYVPDFFMLQEMEEELAGLAGMARVDLVTPRSLSPLIREGVLASARVWHAEE